MTGTTLLRRIISRTRTDDQKYTDKMDINTTQPFLGPSTFMSTHDTGNKQNDSGCGETKTGSTADTMSKHRRSFSLTRMRSHERRESYDSVREQSDFPQSFTKSTRHPGHATPQDTSRTVEGDKWIDILFGTNQAQAVNGRRKSNSFSHLPRFSKRGTTDPLAVIVDDTSKALPEPQRRLSAFEALPLEILETILWFLHDSPPDNEYVSRSKDLASCLRVSRPITRAAVGVLYKHVSIPHSIAFSKLMASILKEPEMAKMTERLDFSRYNNIGFGRTRQASSEIMNITPETIQQCLRLMPNLNEFLVHEHLDDELDSKVISMLFSMPSLEALDLCASSSAPFTKAFTDALNTLSSLVFSGSLKRLSLHECTTLQSPVFDKLLPRLPNLTHLDVAHTLITDHALMSIPHTARLTHLNLGRCTRITGAGVVRFLTTHPAVKDSLVFLNLLAEPAKYRLLRESELATLLRRLPATMRSLNIGGARINRLHMPLLLPLTRYLEELGLSGADLNMDELNRLLTKNEHEDHCTLRYIDLSEVASVTQASLHFSKESILSPHTLPLEVIELSGPVLEHLKKRKTASVKQEWVVRELGRRGWYVRQPDIGDGGATDDGRRDWKMGARWWGMRKVSVAEMDVGGMYGFYAFKRI